MPDNVLIAFDGSPLSERALTYAIENFPNATITAMYVINPIDSVIDVEAGGLPVTDDWHDNAQSEQRPFLRQPRISQQIKILTSRLSRKSASRREIVEYAKEHDIDQIVMGSHGRSGIDRAILGSVAETVTRRARIPVTIIS